MSPEYLALPPARRRWYGLILLLTVFLLEIMLWQHLERQRSFCQTTGVRFASPIATDVLDQVETFTTSDKNTQGIYASFWGQQDVTISTSNGRHADAVVGIGYYGSAEDCLPVPYQQGCSPGIYGNECALSEALAQTLFGSTDIVGMKVLAQKKTYTITGVFSAKESVFLFPTQENLTCAELRGVSWDAPKEDVETWCAAAGLESPQCIVYDPQRVWIMTLLCGFPLFVVGVAFFVTAIRWSCLWPKGIGTVFWFVLAMLAALMLPNILDSLPGWLIPGRWSNFAFWQDLAQSIHEQQQAWKLCAHYWPDLIRR